MTQGQGFGAGAARSRPEPGYLAGAGAVTLASSGSSLNFSLIIHANCIICKLHNLFYVFLE